MKGWYCTWNKIENKVSVRHILTGSKINSNSTWISANVDLIVLYVGTTLAQNRYWAKSAIQAEYHFVWPCKARAHVVENFKYNQYKKWKREWKNWRENNLRPTMVTFIILEEVMKKKHPTKRKCAFWELFYNDRPRTRSVFRFMSTILSKRRPSPDHHKLGTCPPTV